MGWHGCADGHINVFGMFGFHHWTARPCRSTSEIIYKWYIIKTAFFCSKLEVKPLSREGRWCPLERARWCWSLFWHSFPGVRCSSSCQAQKRRCEPYILQLLLVSALAPRPRELVCGKEGDLIGICSYLVGWLERRQTKGQRELSQLATWEILVIYKEKFFICSPVVKHWNQLPREVRECPSSKLSWAWSWAA